MDVFEETVTLVKSIFELSPSGSLNCTEAPERKPVPVIVTDLSAALLAEVGDMAVTVGAGFFTVKPFVRGSLVPQSVVTVTWYDPAVLSLMA